MCALSLGPATVHAATFAPVKSGFPTDPKAKKLLEDGAAAYKEGNFEDAIDKFRKGFEMEPAAAFLYSWAQAERKSGNCRAAIRLYSQFIDSKPGPEPVEYATEQKAACAEVLAAEEPEAVGEGVVDDEPVEDEPIEDAPIEDAPIEETPDEIPDDGAKPWYKDPLGASLVAAGVVGVGAGTGLIVAAQVEEDKASADYGSFADRVRRIENFRIAGGVILGVGGALLIGGIIRWTILGVRQKKEPAVGLLFTRDTAGLTLRGRF